MLDATPTPIPARLKLYNASNFFDQRAVPVEDLPAIAELCCAVLRRHRRVAREHDRAEDARLRADVVGTPRGRDRARDDSSGGRAQHLNKRLEPERDSTPAGVVPGGS